MRIYKAMSVAAVCTLGWATTQGQRTLTPLCGKDFHEELVVPSGDLAFPLDAVV